MNLEKTRFIYNSDVIENGGYLYSGRRIYSACIATRKQTLEINKLIQKYFPKIKSFIDFGCGDGIYTRELIKTFHIKKMVGIDIANQAIKIAQKKIKKKSSHQILFQVGSIYNLSKSIKSKNYTFGILRGVLHHLDNPQKAIQEISDTVDSVIVLEPNGYNIILKLIEQISPYHRRHGEKSYFPFLLNSWFKKEGYYPVYSKYFSIVPYFFPTSLTKILKVLEPYIENIPIVNQLFCGGILIYYSKLPDQS